MSWNLVGHEWAENLLKEHILNNEVRHAYLFTGAGGTGRRSLAIEFACAVNCLQPPAPGEFCGNCRMCKQLQKLQQADLSVIQAEEGSSLIKVEQVRSLERSLSLSPYEAKFRVALLLDFQQANANAQNALLKTLEEAPQKVILLLTADSAENLLPTISSRCEIMRLRPTSVANLEDTLVSRWKIDPEKAGFYAHLANGRVGKALQFADHTELLENRKALLDDFERLLRSSRRERFAYSESLARNRDRDGVKVVLQTWFTYGRDLMMLSNGLGGSATNIDRQEELRDLAGRITQAGALQIVKAVDDALAALEANGHVRLLTDTFFIDLPRIE